MYPYMLDLRVVAAPVRAATIIYDAQDVLIDMIALQNRRTRRRASLGCRWLPPARWELCKEP